MIFVVPTYTFVEAQSQINTRMTFRAPAILHDHKVQDHKIVVKMLCLNMNDSHEKRHHCVALENPQAYCELFKGQRRVYRDDGDVDFPRVRWPIMWNKHHIRMSLVGSEAMESR